MTPTFKIATAALFGTALATAAVASGPADVSAKAPETSVTSTDGKTIVKAPTTKVETSAEGTKVRVVAPHTNVKVDTEARIVRIRVPGYSGDIKW